MDIDTIRNYALQKEFVEESLPFGPDVLVFKVNGKVFLLVPLDEAEIRFNVKCDPDRAVSLREEYPDKILPGYHMNKKHWNTVIVRGLKKTMIFDQIDHSYQLLYKKAK